MSVNERLEILLNKVNQTISDLPEINMNSPEYYDTIDTLIETAKQFDPESNDDFYTLANYTLHLGEVIDRMETGIDNYLTKEGEKDDEYASYEIAYNIGVKDGQIKAYKEIISEMRDMVLDTIYALLPNGGE